MQIGEQYGLAELQQLMAGRGHMLTLAQEMPPEIQLQYHHHHQQQQAQQQQFQAAFHQRQQIEAHHQQQQQNHGNRVYQASSHPLHHEENRQNHHSYNHHVHQRPGNNGIAQQLSLSSDSPRPPSLSVSPPSKRTISPPGIISKQQQPPPVNVNVNGVPRDQQTFEDYDEGFDEGDRSGSGGNGRWPRQETLTLLKIRSEMDSKFREATHKGPLWDEVSRALAEHGYQRSSKKCREKFENLYKYYKKTKEGKAGRQDGKHYRFFSQLEALYGGTTIDAADSCFGVTTRTNLTESPGLDFNGDGASQKYADTHHNSEGFSLSSDSSSDDEYSHDIQENHIISRGKRKRKSWKSKMKMYFDAQMKKFMDRQEAWLEKVLDTLEQREQERVSREEAWRRQEAARLEREHQLWSNERARAATCDAAFISALQKITGQNLQLPEIFTLPPPQNSMNPEAQDQQDLVNREKETYDPNNKRWPKPEIMSLIRLRTNMERRFQEAGAKGPLWEEIASNMSRLGYDRSAKRCKEKWENINKYFRKAKDSNRKRPENSKTCPYFQQLDSLYRQGALGFSNGGSSTTATSTSTKLSNPPDGVHDQTTTDELVLQPCTSSHENDEHREAVEILGQLMPSSEGGCTHNNINNDNNNNGSNGHPTPGASSNNNNCVQFFSGAAENGCNWEGYPMKLKIKQQQQQQQH